MMTNHLPQVTVICLCYNHEHYVEECILSVQAQSYPNIQLIIMDDCSTDSSWTVIQRLVSEKSISALCLQTERNMGNTKAFNHALKYAEGKYVIDLSTDDVLRETRVEKQVVYFESLPFNYGVIYGDASYISEDGVPLFRTNRKGRSLPEGDIYKDLIVRYFIPSPTMMIKKEVMDELRGYDEELAFEDFDFWIRSSRNWYYGYQKEDLTLIRRSTNSLSSGWYKTGDRQLHSNYLICKKIAKLNKNEEEAVALNERVNYEYRQAFLTANFEEATLFYGLLVERKAIYFMSSIYRSMSYLDIDLSAVFGFYKSVLRRIKEK